nr:hypothetical protein [Patescibacteria group bacterium]
MGDNENVTVKQIWLGILLVILFIVGYTGADYLLLRRKDIPVNPPTNTISSVDIEVATSTINPEQGQIISAPLTDWKIFDSYKKTTIYPKGVETPSDYLQNAGQALSNAGRRVEIIGSLEDAYIYIKAGANDQRANFTAIDPRYDGIWFYRKDGQFNGGLLDLSQSRRGEPTQYTELLY